MATPPDDGVIFNFEGYSLDPDIRELRSGTDLVAVEPQVFDLLHYLIRNRNRVVSKDEMIATVWKGRLVSESALTSRLTAVRQAIGDRGEEQRLIRTVPRKGVRFVGAIREAPRPADADVAASALPLPDKPSIAILPFNNLSGDPAQELFADGVVEDIITALSRARWLFVIARNSSFTYKGTAVDVRRVGRELGVRYVLEGSVRKAGDHVRVTTQLVETTTGSHLWAERYDRHLEDIFAIQDEITTSVASRIGPEVLTAEHVRASRKPPQSLDAWECVIRALFHASRQSDDESRNALALLDRALARDPNYAQALGLKAWITVFRAFQGWEEMGQALPQVKPLIAQAMAADNEEPWPYLAQGMVGYATRDSGLAMTALTRAASLNPNSVLAHCLLGIAHAFDGRSTEALACIDYAMRLSPRETGPTDFHLYYAFAHFQGAQYDLGLQFAQQAHRMRPGHPYPLLIAAACAGHLSNTEAAANLIQDLKTILPIVSQAWVEATLPYFHAQDRVRFIEGLARAGL